ncbi:mitochondrial carrier domain-containing protein [Aspergillus ambiguus]|uniref:putative mitochondrial carrier protein n=1 Tax=Aspergillus ambiguus TaxID=176160 RepID=UPI003CCCA89F
MSNSNLDIWISGAFAAVTVDFIVYPFDTLKTRIQSSNYEKVYKDASTRAIRKDILFRGLYQGVWSVVFSTIPSSGAFFTTYEALKHTLNTTHASTTTTSPSILPIRHSLPAPIIHGVSSSAAEMVSCFILTPAEVIKQNAQMVNLQTAQGTPPGGKRPATATIQAIAKFRHKPWKLWSGYTALVGRNLPFTGLHFPIMEYVRAQIVASRKKNKREERQIAGHKTISGKFNTEEDGNAVVEMAVISGISAATSGTIASTVTTPIDVVKTRMMLSAGDGEKRKRSSSWSVGKQTFRDEGVRGLFRGGAIRALWTASALSIYLGMYEGGRCYLEKRRERTAEYESQGEA